MKTMRLLASLLLAVLASGQSTCLDDEKADIVIPGWKDNAKCFELDYDLDCHVYDAKLNCSKTCRSCVNDCMDGARDVDVGGMGKLFCESVNPSYGDCTNDNVSAYCPKTCGTCVTDNAGGQNNSAGCCDVNALMVTDNEANISTARSDLAREESTRTSSVADLDGRVTDLENSPAGGATAIDILNGAYIATCDTTFNDIVEYKATAILGPFQVVCMNNCQPNANVWGTQPFKGSSSICAAAAIYGALGPYGPNNEDTHVTIVPWTPVRNNYNGVVRGPFESMASAEWEAGFIVSTPCPVLSINIDQVPIGYFFRNVNKPHFKQWVNRNTDNSEIKYFELSTGNYWRMQNKNVDWNADVCYASGKIMGAKVACEREGTQAGCLGVSMDGENGVCFWGRYQAHWINANGQKVPNPNQMDEYTILNGCTANSQDARAVECKDQTVIDCTKLRDDNAQPLCVWAACPDGQYYSTMNGACMDLPSWTMECDAVDGVQRHNDDFPAWVQWGGAPQVPMRLDMANWATGMDYFEQASLCNTTVDVSCLDGALLECPGDQQVTTLPGDHRAQVDIRFPSALMPGMEVTVLIDEFKNVPSTFSAAQVDPGTQVLLSMKALVDHTTYIMRYEGRDYLNNSAVSECYVEIRDEEPPTFQSCPVQDVELTLEPGSHQAVLQFQEPTAIDNVDGAVTVSCNYNNNQPWGLMDNSYTVLTNRCTAVDTSGNESVCEFRIIIKDEEDPVWQGCNTDTRKVNMDFGKPYSTVNWQNAIPTATDAAINTPHALNVTTIIKLPDGTEEIVPTNRAIYQFPVTTMPNGDLNGWSTVHFETCDLYVSADKPNGNCAYCEFQVHVVDGTPPKLSCPETQFINIEELDANGDVGVYYDIPTCVDNFDATCTPEYDFVTPFPGSQLTGQGDVIDRVGSYTVQWSATDSSDNWANCEFKVVLYEGCFTYKFEWNEWIRNDVAYVGLPCRGSTSYAGMDKGRKKPCETDALYLDLSPTESTDIGGKRYSVWEHYFFDDGQNQLIRDYIEVDPSLFGKWKLEFHMRETHHPYRMNQFAFYGELEFNAYGLQEWIWYDPTHVTPFVPIADIKHTLKVTCADNVLCPQVTPRTNTNDPLEITEPTIREIGQRVNVHCANGYFTQSRQGGGVDFCCEADPLANPSDPDSPPPTWKPCRNNSGACQACNRPTCNTFRENTCVCEDCAPGYYLTASGDCAPMCDVADIVDKFGKRCDNGLVSGFKLGQDVANCFCECDDGWRVADTCDVPEATCRDSIDGRVDAPQMGTLRNNIPAVERAKDQEAYIPCAQGYSGNLTYQCRLNPVDNTADWYYAGNDCAAYECEYKIGLAGQSCNAVCWENNQMTCNAKLMNEANDFPQFKRIVVQTTLGDSCDTHTASERSYAPYVSDSHDTWCYWQSDKQTQCNITVENENSRICICCPGCPVTNQNPRSPLHWDWLGSGNTLFEIMDNPNRALTCQNPAGFQFEPYNFADELFRDSCRETENVPMPVLCEAGYQSEHWVLARKRQSCHQACDEIVTDEGSFYECDQMMLDTVYTPLTMRNGAIKAGELCLKYPEVGLSQTWYPAVDTSTSSCFYRYDQSASSRCDSIPSTFSMKRLCACKRL